MFGRLVSWLAMRRQRSEIRAAFHQYLDPDELQDLATRPKHLALSPPRLVPVHFVIAQVSEAKLDEIGNHLDRVIDRMVAEGLMVDVIYSSIVSSAFGWPFEDKAQAATLADCSRLAEALLAELGANVRIVYGSVEGYVGNGGSPRRFHYGVTFPDLSGVLRCLLSLEFGEAAQFPAKLAAVGAP